MYRSLRRTTLARRDSSDRRSYGPADRHPGRRRRRRPAGRLGAAIRNTLFGVGAADLLTYVAVLALVAICGAIAAYVPARGALSIDPVSVLNRR